MFVFTALATESVDDYISLLERADIERSLMQVRSRLKGQHCHSSDCRAPAIAYSMYNGRRKLSLSLQ